MTEGVKKWSTEGRVPQSGFAVVPNGKRTFKLIVDKAQERKASNGPFITGVRLQDVTDKETGGPSLFYTIWTSCVSDDENRPSSVEQKGGLLDFVKNGLKIEADFDTTEDGKNISPDSILELLKNNDGALVCGEVYTKKSKGREPEAAIRQFLTE